MNRQPKISVIVAVYNAEKYIKRCIDSLLAQTFTDFEVLLVNDGSTDNSGMLCDEYAKNDKRFRAFHQANQGVGATRHFAMTEARGVYTIHIDPDDWVDCTFLEEMYNKALSEEADMVICDFIMEYKNYRERKIQQPAQCTPYHLTMDILSTRLHGGCCNKMIRRECYSTYGINFIEGLNYGEDMIVIIRLLQHPIKVAYSSKVCYHYDQQINENSYTRQVTIENLREREKYVELLLHCVGDKYGKDAIYSKLVALAFLAIRIDAYERTDFFSHYKRLADVDILHLKNLTFQERFFVWVAFRMGYVPASILMRMKLAYRKMKKALLPKDDIC